MLVLSILILLNAVLNNNTVINTYRLEVAGLPINIIDIAIIVAVIGALVRPRGTPGYVRTDRTHPVMWWLLGLFLAGLLGGLIGAMGNGATSRQIITCVRNYLAAPAALYAAYVLTANLRSAKWFLYCMIVAGVVTSIMILLYFQQKAETTGSVNVIGIRAVMFVSGYAGLVVTLLFYSLSTNLRLMPVLVAIGVLGVCLIGQFATLSRSDWVSCMAALGVTVFLIPRERRAVSVFRMALAVPLLIASMFVGLYVGSQVTRKNLFDTMGRRVMTMLPGYHAGTPKQKAWATRLPGSLRELRIWSRSPLIGGGFGVQDTPVAQPYLVDGLRHNTWTSTLAETGLIGFAAFALMVGSCAYCGLRLVREGSDKHVVLAGMFGVASAAYCAVHGLATMSFNQVRWGLPLFIATGVMLRLRAIQLTQSRIEAEEWAFWEQNPDLWAAHQSAGEPAYQEPVFGNWY